MLLVRAGERRCAVPAEHVVEAMRPLPVERLTAAPPFVRGIARIRGAVVPVVDLSKLLGGDGAAVLGRFVTVRAENRFVALAVSEVMGIEYTGAEVLQALPPLLTHGLSEHVASLGAQDEGLLTVLEASRLVPPELWRRWSTAEEEIA